MAIWDLIKAKMIRKEEISTEEIQALDENLNQLATSQQQQTQTVPPSTNNPQIDVLVEQVKAMHDTIAAQAEENKKIKEQIAQEAQAQQKKKIDALIEKAVKSAVIAPQDAETKTKWELLLAKDFESAAKLLESNISKVEQTAQQPDTGKAQTNQTETKPANRQDLMKQVVDVFNTKK